MGRIYVIHKQSGIHLDYIFVYFDYIYCFVVLIETKLHTHIYDIRLVGTGFAGGGGGSFQIIPHGRQLLYSGIDCVGWVDEVGSLLSSVYAEVTTRPIVSTGIEQ